MSEKFRFMHTMVRVKDQEKAVDFYTRLLGMKVLRQSDNEVGKYTNTFLGYGNEDSSTVLELTCNWGQEEPYELGRAFGHLAIGVPMSPRRVKRLRRKALPFHDPLVRSKADRPSLRSSKIQTAVRSS